MTTYTTEELAREAYRILGLLEGNESPDSDEQALVDSVYSGYFADWTNKEYAYWTKTAIPEEIFWPIVRVIANDISTSFLETPPVEFDSVTGAQMSMGKKGWNQFLRVIARPKSGLPTHVSYM